MNTSIQKKFALAASLLLFGAAQAACRSSEQWSPTLTSDVKEAQHAHPENLSVASSTPIIALTPVGSAPVSPITTRSSTPAVRPESFRNDAITLPAGFSLAHVAAGTYRKELPVVVVVDKHKHLTHVFQYQSAGITEVLSVRNCTGKASTPTPEGRCVILSKQMDPAWKPPVSIDPHQRVIQPWSKTHKNPLGVAFLRLSIGSGTVGLHGTNCPKQIGMSASHGCIRHKNADILKLAKLVHVGTPVYIVHSLPAAKIASKDLLPPAVLQAIYISHTL